MMLSIKAICKSENNEEVTIIGYELHGYCICMTKSGTILHAKHEDLTIVDKEYMESCAKGSIDFEMADFLEKASAKLDQIQSKQLTSIILELQEYRSKIEQGKMIELPCKVGDTVYWLFTTNIQQEIYECYVTEFIYNSKGLDICLSKKCLNGYAYFTKNDIGKTVFLTREEAKKRLKELQNG